MASSVTATPCGACKFLRRKCASDCVFAPYFCCDQGSAKFAAIHKIFGASNVSKLLLHVPVHDRCEAVVAIAYEAQARLRDPVYGCVAHIFALQQQVAILQAQLMQTREQIALSAAAPESLWQGMSQSSMQSMSPQSSLECMDYRSDGNMCFKEEFPAQHYYTRRRTSHDELGELQALAQRMMRD